MYEFTLKRDDESVDDVIQMVVPYSVYMAHMSQSCEHSWVESSVPVNGDAQDFYLCFQKRKTLRIIGEIAHKHLWANTKEQCILLQKLIDILLTMV